MGKAFTATCCLIFICIQIHAQTTNAVLQVDDDFTDEELVRDIFLKGYCNNVSNISAIGKERSLGHFSNGESILGIDQGIIISTGDIALAKGPNEGPRAWENNETYGDVDLEKITDSDIYDAGGIEFEFTPLTERVSFNYVFASEEYCEFVGTKFNDVFGFFVSGPGIKGNFHRNAVNVARLPNSSEYVSINTVNHLNNQSLYIKNETSEDAADCLTSFDAKFLSNIEFDGFTVPMRAEFNVIPCETYTIRLVVGDVQDPILDSAVFLEMNSFDIGGNIRIIASSSVSSEAITSEGCSDGVFTFERLAADSKVAQQLSFLINPQSTATLGADISSFPLEINFEAGEQRVKLPISIVQDGIREEIEYFGLKIDAPCDCFNADEAMLQINDASLMEATINMESVCPNQATVIKPIISGGSPPYILEWSDGTIADSIILATDASQLLGLTVTDACGNNTNTIASIHVEEQAAAHIDGDYEVCPNVPADIEIEMTGLAPWSLIYAVDGIPYHLDSIMSSPYILHTELPGVYTLRSFADSRCVGQTSGMAIVENDAINVSANFISPSCYNTYDGAILVDIQSNDVVSEIKWSKEEQEVSSPFKLVEGDYNLKIENAKGCKFDEAYSLQSANLDEEQCKKLNIYIPNVVSPNGDGHNDDFIIHLEYEPHLESVQYFGIYDRWGNQIFSKENFSPEINDIGFSLFGEGAYLLEPTILSFVTKLKMIDGSSRLEQGTITIIK